MTLTDGAGETVAVGADLLLAGPVYADLGGNVALVRTAKGDLLPISVGDALARTSVALASDLLALDAALDAVAFAITTLQPLDATLSALAGLNSTAGLVEQTGTDAFTKRALGVGASTSVLTRADGDSRFAAIAHDHAITDVTDLEPSLEAIDFALAGKASTSHTHVAANVTDLGTAALRNMGFGWTDLIDLGTMAATFALLGHTHAASEIASGTIATARLGSGTASSTTFLRGDQTWNVPVLTSQTASASVDVSIGTANTWVNGPSLTLAAGTWLLVSHATILRTTTTAYWAQARLSTGSTHYASGQVYLSSVANSSGTVSLTALVTLGSSTTIYVQATATQTATLKAALHTNGSGNNATTLVALRVA